MAFVHNQRRDGVVLMQTNQQSLAFVRQADLIGKPPVTPEEAEHNRKRGAGPRRPRQGQSGIVPFSSATLWRKVRAKEFPSPYKLSAGVTAWKLSEVVSWLNSQSA